MVGSSLSQPSKSQLIKIARKKIRAVFISGIYTLQNKDDLRR
jgi:hypothetical protein